jgi:capsular polysaccharide biosynthesis protein
VSPNIAGRTDTADVALPPVCLYTFPNVLVMANSAFFVAETNVIIERVPGVDDARCTFHGGRLVAHGRHLAEVVKRPTHVTSLENGFFLSGNGDWNYYHWMIELLPKLQYWHQLGPELRAYPLLVSQGVVDQASMLEALALFGDGAEVRVLNHEEVYTVGHLLHINSPNTCPFNLRGDHEVKVTDFLFRPEVIQDWRRRVGISRRPSITRGHRLFLARSGAHRSYNEAEVLPLFTREGFEPVYLERMSLREQVAAMNSAELIAGPTGAAWTNLMFCSHGAKALCWMSEQSKQFSAFSTIASMVGVDLRYFTYPTDARSTHDLYWADYRLDVTKLERALADLLAETRV